MKHLVFLFSLGLCSWAAAQEPPLNRTPEDDSTFGRFTERYEYDHNLPLHAKVLDTRIYNKEQLWQECEHVILVEDQKQIILPWLEKYLR